MVAGIAKVALGYVAVPWLAGKAKLTGKKGGEMINALGDGVAIVGILDLSESLTSTSICQLVRPQDLRSLYGVAVDISCKHSYPCLTLTCASFELQGKPSAIFQKNFEWL